MAREDLRIFVEAEGAGLKLVFSVARRPGGCHHGRSAFPLRRLHLRAYAGHAIARGRRGGPLASPPLLRPLPRPPFPGDYVPAGLAASSFGGCTQCHVLRYIQHAPKHQAPQATTTIADCGSEIKTTDLLMECNYKHELHFAGVPSPSDLT